MTPQAPDELLRSQGLADPARALAEFLPRQRWFSGHERVIRSASIADAAVWHEGEPTLLFCLVEVAYADGGSARFNVPLAVRARENAPATGDRLVAEGVREGTSVVVSDALDDPEAAWPLLLFIANSGRLTTTRGELRAHSAKLRLEGEDWSTLRPLGREQSNSSLVQADRDLIKVFRGIRPGLSPELEMLENLARVGFTHVPELRGHLEHVLPGEDASMLALALSYLHNATDGWTLALTSLRDLYAEAEDRGPMEELQRLELVDDQGSDFVPEATRVGAVTAQLHLALSSDNLPPEMRPEPVTAAMLDEWADEMIADLERADLGSHRAALKRVMEAVRDTAGDAGLAIRFHGDYHLGQVLRTDAGWTILDFEGEPARGLESRRRKASPLRDVAGMLRSFDYAAAVSLMERCSPGEPQWDVLQPYGDAWAKANREAFWEAYVAEAGAGDLLPTGTSVGVLLRAFECQKAVYELGYELGHRPDWAWIPRRFLESLA